MKPVILYNIKAGMEPLLKAAVASKIQAGSFPVPKKDNLATFISIPNKVQSGSIPIPIKVHPASKKRYWPSQF